MTANDQPASDQQHDQAAEHHAEPYAPPAPAAEPAPVWNRTHTCPSWCAEQHPGREHSAVHPGLLVPDGDDPENCGDPECSCPPAPGLSSGTPTVEPDQERGPRRRRRRRYDPAAVLAVMLAGVQVGRAVRNLVETIRVVQESGGLM